MQNKPKLAQHCSTLGTAEVTVTCKYNILNCMEEIQFKHVKFEIRFQRFTKLLGIKFCYKNPISMWTL
jgi:hypothetical protein